MPEGARPRQEAADMPHTTPVPRHIAIIMDGNGRWARRKKLPRIAGHRKGVDVVKRIARACSHRGVEFLTLYTFSTENWKRPRAEVEFLMRLLHTFLQREIPELKRRNIRLLTIGHCEELPPTAQRVLTLAREQTAQNTGLTLVLALNYGSRREILDAALRLGSAVRDGKIRGRAVTEADLESYLDTAGLPDPDLLIRTSGEMRLSNFLLWQLSYSEFYVTDKFWPEFDEAELDRAIAAFGARERRFGALGSRGGDSGL